jgi:hypothetical protein
MYPKHTYAISKEKVTENDKPLGQRSEIVPNGFRLYSIPACFHTCNELAPSSITGIL